MQNEYELTKITYFNEYSHSIQYSNKVLKLIIKNIKTTNFCNRKLVGKHFKICTHYTSLNGIQQKNTKRHRVASRTQLSGNRISKVSGKILNWTFSFEFHLPLKYKSKKNKVIIPYAYGIESFNRKI